MREATAGASFLVDSFADNPTVAYGRKRDWSTVFVDEGIPHESLVG
jgi:hypothetical protein